jgi:membrane protease YdiL (CAAX protease family)
MFSSLRSIWGWMPALLRGAIIACAVLVIGQIPPSLFVLLSLRHTPAIPWFLPMTVCWLVVYWRWLDGRWWPTSTAEIRRARLRSNRLSVPAWAWSLLAGGFGMACLLGYALSIGMSIDLPDEAYRAPFDLAPYPAWTVVAFFLNLALVAGVVEEAGFRGYMLSIVEQRHGWMVAILSVAALFYFVHLSHAYATLAFAPFFLGYSVLHGVLVYLTRSIRPSVVLHVVGDSSILPIQYGAIDDPLGSSLGLHLAFVCVSGVLALLAFWKLKRVAAHS